MSPSAPTSATRDTPIGVTARPLTTDADYRACVELQRAVWTLEEGDVVPIPILRVAQQIGGVALGAFDTADRLLGFVFGITGVRDGRLVHWSDLLAVRQECRGLGIGRQLKLLQRAKVRELGVTRILWTFDPLVAANAHFNFTTLDVQMFDFVANMYGAEKDSAWQLGGRTDRLIVGWDLERSPHQHPHAAPGDGWIVVLNGPSPQVPATFAPPRSQARPPAAAILIPADAHEIQRTEPDAAAAWRAATSDAFRWALASGYAVAGFARDWAPRLSAYLLQAQEPGGVP